MLTAAAAGLAQPHPAVTLAGATLREDEVAGLEISLESQNDFHLNVFLRFVRVM
jgi:hypothetical protein